MGSRWPFPPSRPRSTQSRQAEAEAPQQRCLSMVTMVKPYWAQWKRLTLLPRPEYASVLATPGHHASILPSQPQGSPAQFSLPMMSTWQP